jgi:hypothetical protein
MLFAVYGVGRLAADACTSWREPWFERSQVAAAAHLAPLLAGLRCVCAADAALPAVSGFLVHFEVVPRFLLCEAHVRFR